MKNDKKVNATIEPISEAEAIDLIGTSPTLIITEPYNKQAASIRYKVSVPPLEYTWSNQR